MSAHRTFFAVAILFFAAAVFPAAAEPSAGVATQPVYVPDYSHANDQLPFGMLTWDETQKTTNAISGQDFARFVFTFTNTATKMILAQATNVTFTTNFTTVTNSGFWSIFSGRKYSTLASTIKNTNVVTVTNSSTPIPVTILNVHPSCGCTTAELPPVPWLLPPGTNGSIKVSVNLLGKSGMLFKTVTVTTDHGKMELILHINIQPAPPVAPMSAEERARGIAAAKIDRQAVFRGDCATCHAKNVQGKYGQQLFTQVCAICHEATPRATMVPNLHTLKDQTSDEFWRTWITSGKAGTLMPAFATAQGGPLSDMQIASLATYLNTIIPPHAPAPPAK
jgi:mono/diheme cytochrome c family protein